MQLRHKFFIAISLLTTVPLLILQFGVVERMEKEVQLRTEQELKASLNKMEGELSLILNNQKSIANGLSRVPAVSHFANMTTTKNNQGTYQRSAVALEHFFLNYQFSVPTIQALRFIDLQGKTLVKVKENKLIEATKFDQKKLRYFVADQSPKSFFKDALKFAYEGNVVISDFELGQVNFDSDFCPSMVRYSVPVRDAADNLLGLLVVNMWGTRLDTAVQSAMGAYPAKSFIVEVNKNKIRDGIYLYHPDTKKRFANQLKTDYRFSNEVTEDEWSQIQNTVDFGSMFDSNGRMFFYKIMSPYQFRDSKWLLLIEASNEKIFESINNMRRSIWMLLASLVFVSLILAGWASGRLTRPVHRLAEIIRQFADGERGAHYNGPVNDEVGLAGKAFNYLTTTLEETEKEKENAVRAACQSERLAALGQMAAGIGHEINNPLMNIMSLATLIDEALDENHKDAKNDLIILKKEGVRCARIIQGILNFARETEPSYKAFNLSELIEETLVLLRHRLDSTQIKLITELEENLVVEGDAAMIQQVLVNILLNALQASPANAQISIKANNEKEDVKIEIIDQGAGIEKEKLSKIFDPFFTTKPEGEGTGLGLSVSYGIIKHHGGSISIENMDITGVKVKIVLPKISFVKNIDTDFLEVKNVG